MVGNACLIPPPGFWTAVVCARGDIDGLSAVYVAIGYMSAYANRLEHEGHNKQSPTVSASSSIGVSQMSQCSGQSSPSGCHVSNRSYLPNYYNHVWKPDDDRLLTDGDDWPLHCDICDTPIDDDADTAGDCLLCPSCAHLFAYADV